MTVIRTSDKPQSSTPASRRLRAGIAALALAISPLAMAADVSIGVVANGLIVDSVYTAADLAEEQGLDVKVVEFTDWVIPNTAVVNGDVDINYFQHEVFLENEEKSRNFDLVPLAYGMEGLIGVYSLKIDSFDELKPGSQIAVADDPVNQGRGLKLLAQAGLITLPEGIGIKASVHDIVENPLNLEFVEVPGPQTPRSLEDVTAAVSYPHYIKGSGVMDPADALLFERDSTHKFALRFVVHPDNVDNQDVRKFIRIYQDSPEVKQSLLEAFGNETLYKHAWEDFPPLEVKL